MTSTVDLIMPRKGHGTVFARAAKCSGSRNRQLTWMLLLLRRIRPCCCGIKLGPRHVFLGHGFNAIAIATRAC